MRRRIQSIAVILISALAVGACYRYDPVTASQVAPQRLVELALTDSGGVVLAARIGPQVEALRGRVLADTGGTMTLGVMQTRQRSGNEQDWKGEELLVPHALIASIGERHFALSRTVLFSAALTGALVGVSAAFNGPGFGSGNSSPGGGGKQ